MLPEKISFTWHSDRSDVAAWRWCTDQPKSRVAEPAAQTRATISANPVCRGGLELHPQPDVAPKKHTYRVTLRRLLNPHHYPSGSQQSQYNDVLLVPVQQSKLTPRLRHALHGDGFLLTPQFMEGTNPSQSVAFAAAMLYARASRKKASCPT